VKHCNENLPSMVTGSLLGLDVDGILQVTYAYPFPTPRTENTEAGQDGIEADIDGQEYQIEMMKMLRDVHVDNNCVGWYQSVYLGTLNTNDVVGYQYNYQSSEELSDNSVVILYDPIQTKKGSLVLKAFRLSEEFMINKKSKRNVFIKPSNILEEIPIRITSAGHVSAFIRSLQDTHTTELDCDFDHLAMSSADTYMERNMELISNALDDLSQEQGRFQQYCKGISKNRQEHIRWLNKRYIDNIDRRENGDPELPMTLEDSPLKQLSEPPPRLDSLLLLGQIDRYCTQVNENTDMTFHKLFMTSQFYSSPSTST